MKLPSNSWTSFGSSNSISDGSSRFWTWRDPRPTLSLKDKDYKYFSLKIKLKLYLSTYQQGFSTFQVTLNFCDVRNAIFIDTVGGLKEKSIFS